jgi:hypothetical protein
VIARPCEDFQVEVYDPSLKTALKVDLSGEIRPVGS